MGIPTLEAFACECPVILSDTSSMPEVGGYGVFGLLYYCGFWMISGIKSLASKTTIGKSVFVFIISSMFLSLTGEVIIDYGILIFGILLGILAIDLKNNGLQQD